MLISEIDELPLISNLENAFRTAQPSDHHLLHIYYTSISEKGKTKQKREAFFQRLILHPFIPPKIGPRPIPNHNKVLKLNSPQPLQISFHNSHHKPLLLLAGTNPPPLSKFTLDNPPPQTVIFMNNTSISSSS